MPIVAEQYRFVMGVDSHARTHALAIIDTSSGKQGHTAAFPATPAGLARAGNWLAHHTGGSKSVLISMEGTNSYGAKLKQHLTARVFSVVEVPSPSRALHRRTGKSDALDTLRATQAILPLPVSRLNEAKTGDAVTAIRVLSVARDSMTCQRTAAINALTALLKTVELEIDARKPLTRQQIQCVAA